MDDYANWNEMSWLMHKSVLGDVVGLAGTDGHPIFKYAPYYGGPDNMNDGMGLLLGYNVQLAKYGSLTSLDNGIIMMFGPMAEYYIRDVNAIQIRRWDQARYLNDEVDYTARLRTDGRFVNADNFAWLRVKA